MTNRTLMDRPLASRTQCAIFVAVFAALLYARSLSAGFVYDDKILVLGNALIRDLSNIPLFFSIDVNGLLHGSASNYFRPLAYTFYAFTHAVFGGAALGYHLVNIMFHAANCALVFLIACALFENLNGSGDEKHERLFALLSALFFAVSPVGSGAVYWISGSQEILWVFFALLGFYIALSASGRAGDAMTAACVLFALFSKETAIMAPAIIFAYDLMFRDREFWRCRGFERYAMLSVAVLLYLALRFNALEGFTPTKDFGAAVSLGALTLAVKSFGYYVWKLLFQFSPQIWYDKAYFGSAGTVVAALFVPYIAVLIWLRARLPIFLTVCIVLPLIPVLNAALLNENVIFAERYLYLPSAAFAILLGVVVLSAVRSGRYSVRQSTIAAVVLIASYSAVTISAAAVWHDEPSYWKRAVTEASDKCKPYCFLGLTYIEEGRFTDAAQAFEAAIGAVPKCAAAYDYRGLMYFGKGDLKQAALMFEKAIEADSSLYQPYWHLGRVRREQGDFGGALKLYLKASSIDNRDEKLRQELHEAVSAPEKAKSARKIKGGSRP